MTGDPRSPDSIEESGPMMNKIATKIGVMLAMVASFSFEPSSAY